MSKVKITSNPYLRSTTFMVWDGEWRPIDLENNPNSRLLSKRFTKGFFPFKAREIVDVILREYGEAGAATHIVFEGPDDEWAELAGVCSHQSLAEKVELERSTRWIYNARDVLPFVKDEFESVHTIIAGQVGSREDAQILLDKFRDASSDTVPVCVVGNYSSGKSTFINALIGAELMPSSDKPLTARVFRIERSDYEDRASIKLDYMLNDSIRVTFEKGKMVLSSPACRLAEQISDSVPIDDDSPIIDRARKVLTVINKYKPEDGETLGSVVKVQVPFRADSWMRGKHFVIFDTPGSNSNSNADHLEVLQDAMRGMSDGLPIYVTEFSSLDSNDNADLYEEIRQIDALDERFALIVINKADTADLPEDETSPEHAESVMDTAVVRNLYAQGVYFVSSIMGLGSKLKGEFSDRHYDRCYRQLLSSFDDPEDRYYMQLYRYDLMPEQLRAKALLDAGDCPNRVLANSGLFSVECGIEDFATKYSVYNKCYQSDLLLRELIDITDEALEDASERLEESRRLGLEDLEASKGACLDQLWAEEAAVRKEATDGYLPYMNSQDFLAESNLTDEQVDAWEADYQGVRQREVQVDEKSRLAEEARDAVGKRLAERFTSVVDSRDLLGLKNLATSFAADMGKAFESFGDVMDARRAANRSVSDDLLTKIRAHFDAELGNAISRVQRCSTAYWEERVEAGRSALLALVTDGAEIDDERRDSLRSIIIDFRPLSLVDAVPEIKEIRFPFDPDKLWKGPITIQYNLEMSRRVMQWRSALEPAHEDSFLSWLDDLTDELEQNIVDLNPELRKKLEFIRKNERDLDDLERKRERLHRAQERVSSFMAWRGEE